MLHYLNPTIFLENNMYIFVNALYKLDFPLMKLELGRI